MNCKHDISGRLLFEASDYISGEQFPVRCCADCGLAYTDLSVSDRSPTDAAYYPADYYGTAERYSRALASFLNMLVARRARLLGPLAAAPEGRVLDIGCGQGYFLKYFADRGWRACGVEVSESAAYHARHVLGLDVRVGEGAQRQFDEGEFDVVCLWHVLEHVLQPAALLKEIRRLLKPGGRLLLAVPNFGSREAKFGKAGWFHLDVPRHTVHFTQAALSSLLNEAGWEIEKTTYFAPEYDFFSFVQTVQNRCGLPMNLLYRMIRMGRLDSTNRASESLMHRVLALASMPPLALAGLVWVPIVNALGEGATVNMVVAPRHA